MLPVSQHPPLSHDWMMDLFFFNYGALSLGGFGIALLIDQWVPPTDTTLGTAWILASTTLIVSSFLYSAHRYGNRRDE